jgi:hypothetical protein
MKNLWVTISTLLFLAWATSTWGAEPWDVASLRNGAKNTPDEKTLQWTGGFGVSLDRHSQQPQDASFSLLPATLAEQPALINPLAAPVTGLGDGLDETPFDTGLLNLQGGLGVDWGQDRFTLPVFHQELRSEGERALKYAAFGVAWSRRLDSSNLVSLTAQHGDYAYLEQAARDTNNSLAAFAWSGELSGASHPRLSSSIFLGDESAKDETYRSLGRRYYGVTLDGRFTPYRNHTPYASLRLQRSDYLSEDPLSLLARREDYSRLAAGWDWQVRPNWGLRAEANYSLNNSNVESYGYDHTRVLFSTRFDFR